MKPYPEDRLDLALKAGKFGTWELDPVSRELMSSDQFKAHFGRAPADDFTYEDLNNSLHPEDRVRIPDALQSAMNGESQFRMEYRCIWPDGSVHWIEVNGLIVFGAGGKPEKISGVAQEITERKSVEAELRAAQTKITSMLETVDVATWTVNLSNDILTGDR